MDKRTRKREKIREQTGINFKQHAFLGGVAFRRERRYIWCDPDNPWEHKIISVEKYNDMCEKLEIGVDNDWYATNVLVPIEGNIRKLRILEESEYHRLVEAGLWAEVLDDLEIYNWEHFDRAYAELEKRKSQLNEDD